MSDSLVNNSAPKAQAYTLTDFHKDFPTDDACLEWLMNDLYPNGVHCEDCGKVTSHYKVKARKSYSCSQCGNHVQPTAGTIYHKSSTPLTLWFYAIYLMSSSRCGISAKHLERTIGVTYKTAWRMFTEIRKMFCEEQAPLEGEVEVDETYVGGKRKGKRGRGAAGKTIVAGAVERGGRVVAVKVDNVKASTLLPFVKEMVLPSALVFTDELVSYEGLGKAGYAHKRIQHAQGIYVSADVHTNTIESFWSLFKRSVDGAHHRIGAKYMNGYLNEYTFRWNHRKNETPMFLLFMGQHSSDQPDRANNRIRSNQA